MPKKHKKTALLQLVHDHIQLYILCKDDKLRGFKDLHISFLGIYTHFVKTM